MWRTARKTSCRSWQGMGRRSSPGTTANTPEEVWAPLGCVETARRDGCYVAGYLCYEAGPAFGLPNHPPREGPSRGQVAAYHPEHAVLPAAGDPRPRGEPLDAGGVSVELNVSPEEYTGTSGRINELIASGDTYEVNHRCRACFSWNVDPAEYFLRAAPGTSMCVRSQVIGCAAWNRRPPIDRSAGDLRP